MDISRAVAMLGFTPTATAEAVRRTIAFYEEAFYAFPTQRDEVLSELFATAIPKVHKNEGNKSINQSTEAVSRKISQLLVLKCSISQRKSRPLSPGVCLDVQYTVLLMTLVYTVLCSVYYCK